MASPTAPGPTITAVILAPRRPLFVSKGEPSAPQPPHSAAQPQDFASKQQPTLGPPSHTDGHTDGAGSITAVILPGPLRSAAGKPLIAGGTPPKPHRRPDGINALILAALSRSAAQPLSRSAAPLLSRSTAGKPCKLLKATGSLPSPSDAQVAVSEATATSGQPNPSDSPQPERSDALRCYQVLIAKRF